MAANLAGRMVVTVAACAALAACASAPTVVTRTEIREVPVDHVVPVPATLSADCAPEALAGTTAGEALARLASVEGALAACRDQLAKIRALPPR